jgi:hypothetical protein
MQGGLYPSEFLNENSTGISHPYDTNSVLLVKKHKRRSTARYDISHFHPFISVTLLDEK